ncbi:MAG: hypothetical protein ACK5JM_07605, partial [Rhodoblastus sp.]
MREILTIIAACLVALLTAALVAPPFIDWTRYGDEIAQRLGAEVGGSVTLEGPVEMRLLPAPRLTAGAIEARWPGLGVRARRTVLELSAPALLRGAFEFTEIALERADVSVDETAAGAFAAGALKNEGQPVAVARLRLDDATIRVSGAWNRVLEHVEMTLSADTLAGPFRGKGVWRDGDRTDFSFATGVIEGEKLRSKFSAENSARKWRGEATGDVAFGASLPEFSGQATLSGDIGGAPMRARFALKADNSGLEAQEIDGRLGDEDRALNFSGKADFSREKGFHAELAAANLDLDRFRGGYRLADVAQAAPAFATRLRLAADSVMLGGDILSQVKLGYEGKPDMRPLVTVEAGLPGRSRLTYSGAADFAAPALDGRIRIETREARRLGAYLAPFLPQAGGWLTAPPFARLVLDGAIRADRAGLALEAREMEVERSRLSGHIEWREAQPATPAKLTLKLNASVIDVDGLPDLKALAGLARANDFYIALEAQALRVARLGAAAAETGRLRLLATRAGGTTRLDEFAINGLGGADIAGAGRMNARGGGFDFKLDAEKLADLAALVRRLAPGAASEALFARASALSPAHLTFGMATDSSGEFTQINLAGEAGGARYSAQVIPAGEGRMQARFSAQAAEAAILMRQAGLAVLPLRGVGGARLEAQGEGLLGAPLQTKAALDLGRLSLRFEGETQLTPDRMSANGALKAQSDDLAPLAPLFAFGAPDPSLHIPLRGTARLHLDGQGLALHKIDAEVSGVRASGDLQRDWAGVISGALAIERLSASDLAGLVLGPAQPAASGAVWPSLKFAPSRFDPPQANIALDVAHLDLGAGIAARDAHMNLALGPGALVAQDMAMALGTGRLSGEIALRREGAAATFRARLSGQDIKADVQPFSARVGGALDVSGSGGSSAELVASLAGQGRLRFSDTRIAHAAPDALVAVVAHEDAPATIVAHEDALDARALEKKLDDAFDKGAQE